MMTHDFKPLILIQSRHHPILSQTNERLNLYRAILQRRLDHAERDAPRLKIPRLRGMRLRLPGKPFHSTPEIFFQEGGRTRFELPHQKLTASPGDVLVIPAWIPHGELWSGDDFLNLILVFHQADSFILHFGYRENGSGPLRVGTIDHFRSVDRFSLLRYLEEISELPGKDVLSQRLRLGLYLALLSRLIKGLSPSLLIPPPKNDRVIRCREMIEAYSCKMDFSVAWLARELGCTPDHISRHFRARTGYRIMEAVHGRRILHARHLLNDSNMNIAEIAWACGYSQPSYFNRLFRSLTGTTPKALRREVGRRPRHRDTEDSQTDGPRPGDFVPSHPMDVA